MVKRKDGISWIYMMVMLMVLVGMVWGGVSSRYKTDRDNWNYWDTNDVVVESFGWSTAADSEVVNVSSGRIDGEFLYVEMRSEPQVNGVTAADIEVRNWRGNSVLGGGENFLASNNIVGATSIPFVSGAVDIELTVYAIGGASGTLDVYYRKSKR